LIGGVLGLSIGVALFAGQARSSTLATSPSYLLSPTLQHIKSSGTLRACVDPEFPPEVYTAKNGQPAGFDVDLTKALATALGVKISWVPSSFDGLIAGIQSGKCDYALSGITPRGTRALAVSFAKPTLAAAELVVVSKSQSGTTIAALNKPSIRFCGQSGTGSEFDAKKYFPKTKITLVPSASDCLLQLLSGKADASISDSVTGNGWLKAHPSQLKLVAQNEGLPGAPVGAAVPLGDLAFAAYLNVFFGEFINNGDYEPLFTKDMGYKPDMDHLLQQRGNF
jgi:polar amino acid transport system substrate-binding protein